MSNNGRVIAARIAPVIKHISQLGKSAPAIAIIGSHPAINRLAVSKIDHVPIEAFPITDMLYLKKTARNMGVDGCSV